MLIYLEAVPKQIRLKSQIGYAADKNIPLAPWIPIIGFCCKTPAKDINSPMKFPENGVPILASVAKKKIKDNIGVELASPL